MKSSPFAIILLFIILPISSSLAQTQTNGNIAVGTFLTANQTQTPWLSPSGDFAFGFQFIRQHSLYLLCIWFNNIPEQTIAWYPRNTTGGVLVPNGSRLDLNAQLGLVLTSPQGTQLWSSNLRSYAGSVDHGFINDTGNFVLIGSDDNSTSLWESFANPTDTLLPTQAVEMTGVVESRLSDTNFSRGRFQFRLLADGNAVLNPRNDVTNLAYHAYFWSNTFDGSNSSNSGRQLILQENGHIIISLRNGRTVDLTDDITQSGAFYYRATLNFDGVLVVYSHPRNPNSQQNWTILWTRPNNICLSLRGDIGSGACGFNSICNIDTNRRPYCECPPGYSLFDPNNRYGSCKQDFSTSCDERGQELSEDLYRFEELSNIDWPLNDYEQMEPFSQESCRTSCLNDCFCAVAIHRDNSCWKKKLPLSNGRVDTGLNSIAFLKIKVGDNVPKKCPNNRKTLILVVSTLLGSSVFINFLLLSAGFFLFFFIYKKKTNKPIMRSTISETILQAFSFQELVRATNGFSEELGRGAFGVVYKGVIEDINGMESYVAIKKLDKVAEDGEREFRAELSVIAHTHHKNLVRLLGFCDEAGKSLLVYEYMSNGTLASFLFGATKPSWKQRIEIALAVAKGILYLHEECATQIIHCDIKPQNVLLDDHYNARISDFGLSKLLMVDQSYTQTGLRGTKGYVAPEWFRNTKITTKVDVYSFGVLLLEIITCRKSVVSGEAEVLVDWVWDCFQAGNVENLVENDVEALNDIKILKRFVLVGIWCIQEDPLLRPNIKKVYQMLEGLVQVRIPPCPFPFSVITN